MGLASWLAAGIVAFGLSRFLRTLPTHWAMELPMAIVAATAAGLIATAADFGGWSELDLRAVTFCLLAALSAIALLRLGGVIVRRTRA